MPLPQDFNSWEHFQDTVKKVHNRIVREEFSDVTDDDNITVPRGSLKVACLIDDNDTVMQVVARLLFYYFDLRKAQDLMPPIYGIPEGSTSVAVVNTPRVLLFFQEDLNDVQAGYAPVTGEITFRLMGETPQSMTEGKLNTLANRIKTEFASGNGYVWNKGKTYYSYREPDKGYRLQILARTEASAKELIGKVLDIQSHSPDWGCLTASSVENPTAKFPESPGTQVILGKSRKKKRLRPNANVRFQYAVFTIQGVVPPIPLVDRSGIFRNAIERVW